MKLNDYKLAFVALSLIGILLIASPVLSNLIDLSIGEKFSELYLLDPEHETKNYPFNVQPNQNYSVYVGVANRMSCSQYYILYLKFRNQTDELPNASLGTYSALNPLYEYRFVIPDAHSCENQLTFSLSDARISENKSFVTTLTLNGLSFSVNKPSALNSTVFYYQLFFELWTYSDQSGLVYSNQYVGLQLNLTKNSLN